MASERNQNKTEISRIGFLPKTESDCFTPLSLLLPQIKLYHK